jgi:hypothetical protein
MGSAVSKAHGRVGGRSRLVEATSLSIAHLISLIKRDFLRWAFTFGIACAAVPIHIRGVSIYHLFNLIRVGFLRSSFTLCLVAKMAPVPFHGFTIAHLINSTVAKSSLPPSPSALANVEDIPSWINGLTVACLVDLVCE